ncbi:hypothetical protein [Mycolicibacterium neoaurum]|uniref:hypothetical protein n=1 Tax=Mycolicibacterium neoaurum TaxID=1795 RepID=UPI001F4D0243|nr:hypothetical protein [Mycolicibacterium neoaurum]
MTKTELLPINVVWPDAIGGAAVETDDEPVGLLTFTSETEILNIALTPTQTRQVAALFLNVSDALDQLVR